MSEVGSQSEWLEGVGIKEGGGGWRWAKVEIQG